MTICLRQALKPDFPGKHGADLIRHLKDVIGNLGSTNSKNWIPKEKSTGLETAKDSHDTSGISKR